MQGSHTCPKCGGSMSPSRVGAVDGRPVSDGATLRSWVCAECGYAELYAEEPLLGPAVESAPVDTDAAIEEARLRALAAMLSGIGLRQRLAGTRKEYGTDSMPIASLLGIALTAALGVAGIVILYLAAGPVMDKGGFVASGGPYEIAHPAPDWVWLVPVSINVAVFALLGNAALASRWKRPHLLFMAWVALFGSLGWRFLYYGFTPPGGGISWAWLVCGVVFWAMVVPVLLILADVGRWRGFKGSYGVATALGVVGGFTGSMWLFSAIAG